MFGYRGVLISNTVIMGLLILLFATIGAAHAGLVDRGCRRSVYGFFTSLQYTSMNTLVYADITEEQTSSASSIASTMQQMSISFGVAVGVAGDRVFHSRPLSFQWAANDPRDPPGLSGAGRIDHPIHRYFPRAEKRRWGRRESAQGAAARLTECRRRTTLAACRKEFVSTPTRSITVAPQSQSRRVLTISLRQATSSMSKPVRYHANWFIRDGRLARRVQH